MADLAAEKKKQEDKFEEVMHVIQKTSTYSDPAVEEEVKQRRDQRSWVEFPNTGCHQGDHNAVLRIDHWEHRTSIPELQAKALELGSVAFKTGNGYVKYAVVMKGDLEFGPRHFSPNPNCNTWWYKPVWNN